MEYIVILFVYNIFIIMVLANVLASSVDCAADYLTIYRLEKSMQIDNSDNSLDDILKVAKHHSIFGDDEANEFVDKIKRTKSINIYSEKGKEDGTK